MVLVFPVTHKVTTIWRLQRMLWLCVSNIHFLSLFEWQQSHKSPKNVFFFIHLVKNCITNVYFLHFVHSCPFSPVLICMHVNKPSVTVFHVVSLTVPTNTAPVGSNPFEEDEDEEEMAEEPETTVISISVNKEEIKTLVNRRKSSPPTCSFPAPPYFWLFSMDRRSSRIFFYFLAFPPFGCFCVFSVFLSSGGKPLRCSAWSLNSIEHNVNVWSSHLTITCHAEPWISCAWGRMSLLREPCCISVLQSDRNVHIYIFFFIRLLMGFNFKTYL